MSTEFPGRIGVGDGPGMPCRFVAADMAFRSAEQFPHVPLPAPVSVASGRRDEDGTVYFDVTFDRDALARWIRSMNEALRAVGEEMRRSAEAAAQATRPLAEWIQRNGEAIERAAVESADSYLAARMSRSVRVTRTLHSPDVEDSERHFAQMRSAADFIVNADGAPTDAELESAKNWAAGGSTCSHVCGPDPGHVCDARAVTMLRHPLPSGGTRTLPLCGPCADAEDAAQPDLEPIAASPMCRRCGHPRRDHSGRADHLARLSRAAAGDPWCHGCDDDCDFDDGAMRPLPLSAGGASTVCVGMDFDAEHRAVLQAYREAHGMPWTGAMPTVQMVNQAVDWWNARQEAAGG